MRTVQKARKFVVNTKTIFQPPKGWKLQMSSVEEESYGENPWENFEVTTLKFERYDGATCTVITEMSRSVAGRLEIRSVRTSDPDAADWE